MTWVPAPASFSKMLFTVAPNAGTDVRSIPAASAEIRPARRLVRIPLFSSRISVTLFWFQLDRQRLGLPEGVLHHLNLGLRDPGDVAVHDGVPDAQYKPTSAAVFDQRELVRRPPHDAHQVYVPHVDEGAVALGRELPVEKREERIAAVAARIDILLASEEDA